ncbi:MAG: tripartite tricarboxylate transporter TctB family protein [Variibacter sp.]
MRLSDRVTGSFLVGLGAISAYGGSLLPPVPGQPVGPNIFPIVIGVGLAVCGLLIALGIGHDFETNEDIEPAADGSAVAARSMWWILLPPLLLLFYVFAVEWLGFVLTSAIIAFITSVSLRGTLKIAIAMAIASPLIVHLVFAKLLRVPLPAGLLPLPW